MPQRISTTLSVPAVRLTRRCRAVAAHIQNENVEQRSKRNSPVDSGRGRIESQGAYSRKA